MRHQWLAVTMLVGLLLGETTAVDGANNFFVSPVTTDVQRRFVTQANVYAIVDGIAFLQATQAGRVSEAARFVRGGASGCVKD